GAGGGAAAGGGGGWGAGERVGAGAACAQAARAAAMPVSPPYILPSRAELFILANAASPQSFRGTRNTFGPGVADETLRMARGILPREPGPGAVVERRREPVGAEPARARYVVAARLSALPTGSPAD